MTTKRMHPAPPRADFHMSLLWLRSMEIAIGAMSGEAFIYQLHTDATDMADLFSRYRSPWRA